MATDVVPRSRRACRSCGADMWWSTTHRGRRIPLDAEPVDPIKLGSWRGVWYYEAGRVRPALPSDPGPFWLEWSWARGVVPHICSSCGHRDELPKGSAPRCSLGCGGQMMELVNPT